MKIYPTFLKPTPRGVSAAELSIAIPVILVLFYGIFYISFALISKSVLTYSASAALSTVITEPAFQDIPYPYPTCPDEDHKVYCDGVDDIKAEIKSAIASSYIAKDSSGSSLAYLVGEPELILPEVAPGETLTKAYTDKPIVIKVRANLRPLLPGMPDIQLEGIASGFRELHDATSYQVMTDCNGVPYDDPNYEDSNQECICKENEQGYFTNAEGKTQCYPCPQHCYGSGADRVCVKLGVASHLNTPGTPGYFEPGHQHRGCDCPDLDRCRQLYGPRARVNTTTCGCVCHGADGMMKDGQCVCNDNFDIYNPGNSRLSVNPVLSGNNYSVHFKTEKTSSCVCEVDYRVDNGVRIEGGGGLTPSDCAKVFGGEASNYSTPFGCSCSCNVCGGHGSDIHDGDPTRNRNGFNTINTCDPSRCRCARGGYHTSTAKTVDVPGVHGGIGKGFTCECKTVEDFESPQAFENATAERVQACAVQTDGVYKYYNPSSCRCEECDVAAVQATCDAGQAVDVTTCQCDSCGVGFRLNDDGTCQPITGGPGGAAT